MKNIFIALFTLLLFNTVNAQLNLDLVGQLPYSGHGDVNDIWGYVDAAGNEYALVGLQDGTSIVDLSDPANPIEVFFSGGANSIWRDLKVWNNHAYIVNETGNGMKIIDMSNLPGLITVSDVYQFTCPTFPFSKAHDIYIDENGFGYIMGANIGVGGAIIVDLNTNPKIPFKVGVYNDFYIHDGMVRGDTLWAGCVNDGFMAVIDVSDKTNPITMVTHVTPNSFTHNVWPSDDGQTVYTTDEKSNAFIASYDVSDLANINELDRIQSSPGENVIPHNVFVVGDYLVTSYYRDGVVIHDASNPSNIVEVGHYDTSPFYSGGGFNGCWGVYPYLPSGLIIASDIENGLFVFDPTYSPASYILGNVTDSVSGAVLDGVKVHFLSTSDSTNTNVLGDYEAGLGISGTYDITYSKWGYISKTEYGVVLTAGGVTIKNVELKPSVNFTLEMKIVDALTLNPISNAKVIFSSPLFVGTYVWHTDINGFITIQNAFEEYFNIQIGKWGYKRLCLTQEFQTEANNVHVYELEPGYEDDFKFDFGWTVSAAFEGKWEREEPIGINYNGNPSAPEYDSQSDCNNEAFVTGNYLVPASNSNILFLHDPVLTSPSFDLSSYSNPYLSFEKWFFNDGANTLGDSLTIKLENGTDTVMIDYSVDGDLGESSWSLKSFQISNFITSTSSMHLIVTGMDNLPNDIVEAGFDNFKITEGTTVGLPQSKEIEELTIYPNPFNSELTISFNDKEMQHVRVDMLDLTGRIIDQKEFKNTSIVGFKNDYKRGIYFMNVYGNGKLIKTEKVIKL